MICALCAADVRGDAYTREPLGRNDALVVVCLSCSSPIVEDNGPDRGYAPTGGLPTYTESQRVPRLAVGDGDFDAPAPFFARTEGSRIVRLHIKRFGCPRDAAEAVLADIPSIADEVRFLGTLRGKGLHVYETFISVEAVRGARQLADRDRRKKLGRCINSDEHGDATDGVLCRACRDTHRRSA